MLLWLRCFSDTYHSLFDRSLLVDITLILPSRHTEKDYLFWYARRFWSIHCQDSGRWDKHPHLLKEISETLDYCERYRRQYLQYLDGGGFLQWFEVQALWKFRNEM